MSNSGRVFFQVCKIFQNLPLALQENWRNKIKMSFYAVANGRTKGIFNTWAECEAQVKGFSGARYKKFNTVVGAQDFISSFGGSSTSAAKEKPNNNNKYSNTFNNSNLKRPYSTSSSTNQQNGKNSGATSRHKQEDSDCPSDDSADDLETMLNKQMDDIEKRLKSFTKGVDKIMNPGKKNSSRSAILIEPPQAKKSRKRLDNFEEDSEGYVQVYTDGACSSNGRSGARAGIGVYWGEGHSLNVSEPVTGRATNNCGEIQAATRAIKQAIQSGVTKLTINTDSQFLINSVTKWIPGWKRKGWKLASGEPVKNEIDFKELDSVQDKIYIRWNYVEAHKSVHGNERADQLAKAGAAMYNK